MNKNKIAGIVSIVVLLLEAIRIADWLRLIAQMRLMIYYSIYDLFAYNLFIDAPIVAMLVYVIYKTIYKKSTLSKLQWILFIIASGFAISWVIEWFAI